MGRPTLRAGLDDFKHPWRHAREHGYDRVSGLGYYRNAYDHASVRDLLLAPAGPGGSGQVVRPEYNDLWDDRIWLDVDPEQSLTRGIARDSDREGLEEATRLHRDRYHPAEQLYLTEVNPRALADVVIDNRDFANPRILNQDTGYR